MALLFYRIGNFFFKLHVPVVPRLMTLLGRMFFGLHVDSRATIGHKTRIAYGGSGVVVHRTAIIGANCLISPGVVIGGRNGQVAPTIGNDVKIFSNAALLGRIIIGDRAVIGPNVVLTKSVSADSTWVVQKPRSI
jgi:serine O-acetyltransferase